MPDRVQDLTNHRKVAQASKNYTDQKAEEILWQLAENDVSTSNDNTTASTKTVPSNATRCKIKRIYGLTQKFNPSVAYDDTSYMIKTMPSTVYDFDVSKVDGNSVKYNQLVQNGNFESDSGWASWIYGNSKQISNNECHIYGTTNLDVSRGDITITSGHKYLVVYNVKGNEYSTNSVLQFANSAGGTTNVAVTSSYQQIAQIVTASANTTRFYVFVYGNNASNEGWVKNVNIFDLTAIFGSGNEPNDVTTAKASLLTMGINIDEYNAYNIGEIHNFAWTGVKVEGFNKWDEEWELGSIQNNADLTNAKVNSNNAVRSKNAISIIPNTTYYSLIPNTYTFRRIGFYDKNGGYVGFIEMPSNSTFTTPNNAYQMLFTYSVATTYSNDICINISGSANGTYVPYIQPTTISVDLTTILYNGSPLFTNGLLGYGGVNDSVTPYKATSEFKYLVLNGSEDWQDRPNFNDCDRFVLNTDNAYKANGKGVCDRLVFSNTLTSTIGNIINNNGQQIVINYSTKGTTTLAQFKTWLSNNNVILVIQRATPIEVSIDWSATLRHITGYSNGTITLLNTYNMDTDNTITYNSIIQENCCAKIVQSRGGNVVKTINLPTQASDGYSAGSVNNVRDLTTSKRIGNVSTYDLGLGTYTYDTTATTPNFKTSRLSTMIANSSNIVSKSYTQENQFWTTADNWYKMSFGQNNINISNPLYTDGTTFKTANDGELLYYELADASKTETSIDSVDNVIEVEPSDVLSFYDENDNLVTVPSDLTYRIEVAR